MKRRPDSATIAGSPTLQAWLENPQFREAWDAFIDQLGVAGDEIAQGREADPERAWLAAKRLLDTVEDHGEDLPILPPR